MESFDSSPNYMKAPSSFDAKKEYSPGGSVCDDMISVTSSTCGSSVNKSYAPKLNNNGIKRRTNKNKTMKNFGNVKSFRKRAKSRIIHQSPVTISDEDSLVDSSESSPNYLKATSCSRGKKMVSLIHNNSLQTLSRTSSLRNVRIFIKKTSFKPKRSLSNYPKVSEDVAVTRATYSSALKDSKFPKPVELHSGGAKSEKVSAVEVCRYHHCSVHGHCQGTHDPVSQTKRFLYKKRLSLKKQKSVIPKTEPGPGGENRSSDKKKNIQKSKIIPIVEQLSQDENGVGSCEETCPEQEKWLFMSLNKNNNEIFQNGFAEQVGNYIEDSATLSRTKEKPNKDCPKTPVIYDEVNKKDSEFSSSSSRARDFKVNNKVTQVNDSETNSPPTQEGGKLQFSKQSHISMWHLIHQHMSSDSLLARKNTSSGGDLCDPEMGTMNNGSENQEIELHKMFAIKLVRQAIEKILLPEVQDQISDDQLVTSESTPRTEILERNQTEAITDGKFAECDAADKDEGNESYNPKQESLIIDNTTQNKKEVVRKSEKKAPKHWSNLKKWILLQRFIRELEKVRKFNPKKPQLLPLNPDPEAEKVNLRHQTVDRRKSAEEWMLDYAIRQVVGQLAPTQKRKVALLVKAFETVVPTKEDPQVQYGIPRLKSDEPVFEGIQKDSNISLKSVYFEGDFVPRNENSKLEDPDSEKVKLEEITADETEREATRKPQDLQENVVFNPFEEKTEESVPCVQTDRENHIKMWHMIYHHVVSGIAKKVGSRLLDGAEDDGVEDDTSNPTNETSEKIHVSNSMSSRFTKSDALKLVKEAVDEIVLPETQDDSSDTQSITSELSISDQDISDRNFSEIGGQFFLSKGGILIDEEGKSSRNDAESTKEYGKAESQVGKKTELPKAKNWSKLKKFILLKRSIKALEKARKVKPQPNHLFPETPDTEREKIDLRHQIMVEKKKAEQWMLDYAVQRIVTKLTPARKRRVSMLVEAFEAVVPLPEM